MSSSGLMKKINESDHHFQNSVRQLREIINQVHLFRDADACIDFLTDIDQQQVFFLASKIRAQQLIAYIHPIAHLLNIYVISNNQEQSQSWIKAWPKIKGIFTRHYSDMCRPSTICQTMQ